MLIFGTMRRFIPFAFLLIVIFLSGCSAAFHYAEFIRPSDRYIPSDLYKMGLAQRAVTESDVAPVYTEGIPYEKLPGVPEQTVDLTFKALEETVKELGRFDFTRINDENARINRSEFASSPFSKEEIERIGNSYDLDGIISLDGFEMVIRTSGEVNVISGTDASGFPVRVPEFSKESQVSLTLLWRVYDCRRVEMIDEYQETYERYFGRVSYSEEDINQIKPEDMGLMDVAGAAAYDYYTRISPHWEEDYRKYYYTGSRELQAIATDLQATGDWERAAGKWKELTNSENLKVRYRAMYNMASASEILGRPKVAKEWITRAIALNPEQMARNYAEKIEKQILVYEVVNRQLGIN